MGDFADFSNDVNEAPNPDDCVTGEQDDDTVVGDNYAETGNAYNNGGPGGDYDIVEGDDGNDWVFGDNYANGNGNASGGSDDWLEGSNGNDHVVGDSGSVSGDATATGIDGVNTGPGNDVGVGDNMVVNINSNGNATGGGTDITSASPALFNGHKAHIATLEGNDDAWGDNKGPQNHTSGGGDDWLAAGGCTDDPCAANTADGDTVHGESGVDTINSDAPNQVTTPFVFGQDTVSSGPGADTVYCGTYTNDGLDQLDQGGAADAQTTGCEDITNPVP